MVRTVSQEGGAVLKSGWSQNLNTQVQTGQSERDSKVTNA